MKTVQNIFNKTITILTLVFVLFSLVCTSIYSDKNEFNFKNALPNVSVAFLICIVIFLTFKIIDKINTLKLKWLVISLFAVFILGEIFVLLNLSSVPNTDAYRCIDTAIGFANGVEKNITQSSLYYKYFCAFSNNNMYVRILQIYFSFLKLFNVTDFLLSARVLNAIALLIAIIFSFLSTHKLFGIKTATKTLVVITLCPVFYVFIEWVYTLTLSLPFMMALFYVLVCLRKSKSNIQTVLLCIISALLAVIGYLIRPTAIFPLIAFVLVNVFKFKIKNIKKCLICFISFFLVGIVTFTAASDFANSKFKQTLDKNHPITHWIMMGLGDGGGLSYDDYALTKSFGDTKQEKIQGNLKEISRRINEKGVIGLAKHFSKKTAKTFTDGTFGIEARISHQQKPSSLKQFINGKNDLFFTLYCQGFRVFVYLFAGIYLIKILLSKKNNHTLMPIIITVLGGYVFYLIWEAKQTYSLPFLIFTIILAVCGMDSLNNKISLKQKLISKIRVENIIAIALIICLGVSLFSSFIFYDDCCKNEYNTDKIVVDNIVKKYGHSQKAKTLSQEFICYDDFDYITLYAYDDTMFKNQIKKKKSLQFTLLDENQNVVYSSDIKYSSFDKQDTLRVHTITLDKITNYEKAKYIICINCDNKINWLVSNSNGIDIYKGALTLDNNSVYSDLAIKVGYKNRCAKMPIPLYFMIWFLICTPQIMLILSLAIKPIKNKLYSKAICGKMIP